MNTTYTLAPVIPLLRRGARAALWITLVAILTGLSVYLIRPKRYKASVEFFIKNPLYADRSYLYSSDARMIDYFAGEDDVERLKSLIWSDTVQDQLIREMHLAGDEQPSPHQPAVVKALKKQLSSSLNIYRTESMVVILTYTDKDERRAAAVAERAVMLLEQQLRGFYNEMRHGMYAAIAEKVREEDSTIAVLTDSLAILREQYGIYDIISPARYNIMLSAVKHNGRPGFAKGVELVQNVEAVKDELVSDRSKHITLAGQYATSTKMNDLPITRILKVDRPPYKAEGPGLLVVLAASALAGLFAGLMYTVVAYRRNPSLRPQA